MSTNESLTESPTLMGHPPGLFTLFFAEMWERFSYYGMRALLVFYMIKGFLGYNDSQAYGVYAAYGALVYATPFIGGMLADRLLGARRAVVLGGLLMAAGHLAMTVENETVFFIALALLICGNGFFKPNISTIVGGLYPKDSPKKDTGFTIFYMGINLGAAMSPVICGYVGEVYGWHYGFGLATGGMLIGVAIFVAPTRLTQALILLGALGTAGAMLFIQDNYLQLAMRAVLGASLIVSGVIAYIALGRGGIPQEAGGSPSEERLNAPALPSLRENAVAYYLAIIASILALSLVVVPSSAEGWMIACIAAAAIVLPWVSARNAIYLGIAASVPIIAILVQRSQLAGYMLFGFGMVAFASLIREAIRSAKVERERMYVVLILMFFSMLFWAFFEQAGSSLSNFTDRNVDRVFEDRHVRQDEVGSTITFRVPFKSDDSRIAKMPQLTQEQLGQPCDDELLARVKRAKARQAAERESEKKSKQPEEQADWGPGLVKALESLLQKQDEGEPEDGDVRVSLSLAPSNLPEDGLASAPESAPEDGSEDGSESVSRDAKNELVFTFTRTGELAEPLRVSFDVSGTAVHDSGKEDDDKDHTGGDYRQEGAASFNSESGMVVIPAGEASATVVITPNADDQMELDETVVLTLTEGAGYSLGKNNEATATIDNDDKFFTLTHLDILRAEAKRKEATPEDMTVDWPITEDHIGMGIGGSEIPATEFQAVNPIFILIFGLVFSTLWSVLATLKLDPSTPVKFSLGLLQLSLAFGVFWYGAQVADGRGMVLVHWLVLGYLLQTTGELCLSPVGLSMVTKLSPGRMVSTVMGAWFLATAFSNYLAGIIAMFTSVSHGADGEQVVPPPIDTVDLYGDVFGVIALTAMGSAAICFALSPLLNHWMHHEVVDGEPTETD